MKLTDEVRHACLDEGMDYCAPIRSKARAKAIAEVFTPTALVLEMLEAVSDTVWEEGKTFLEPCFGRGNFLAPILIIKMSLGHQNPLKDIYGIELMQDNVDDTKQRLIDIAGDTLENWETINWNLRCADFLTFDINDFDRPLNIRQAVASK